MIIDAEWIFASLDEHLTSSPTVWDASGIFAAVARHATDVVSLHAEPPDTAWRAAALLHTLTVCPPLDSPINEYFAASAAYSYLVAARVSRPMSLPRLADLVESAQGKGNVFSIAEVIRAETI
jgi:hypothetical protein